MVDDFAAIEFCYSGWSIALSTRSSTRVLQKKTERSSGMLAFNFLTEVAILKMRGIECVHCHQ